MIVKPQIAASESKPQNLSPQKALGVLARKKDLALAEALFNREETAQAEVFLNYYDSVIRSLVYRFPVIEQDVIADRVFDAINHLVTWPMRYDPARSSLRNYLLLIASRDLMNLLKKPAFVKQRQSIRLEDSFRHVSQSTGNNPEDDYILLESIDLLNQKLSDIFPNVSDQKDRQVAELILAGVRKTSAYANVLSLQNLSASDQKLLVKKEKDRIKVRMKRMGLFDFIQKHFEHG